MSIKNLKLMRKEYLQSCSAENWQAGIYNFMTEVINTFEALSNVIAQKQDVIDVKDIKEVKLLNREYDICGLCKHYDSDIPYCDIHPEYGELCERDTCDDYEEGD